MILLDCQKDLDKEEPTQEDLYDVGTVAVIMRMLKLPDGRIRILVQGLARAEKLLTHADPQMRVAAYRMARQAGSAMHYAGSLSRDASPAVRREVALSLRDVPAEQSLHLLIELAKGYDGKDRSYLEAWGIGGESCPPGQQAAAVGGE